MGVQLKNKLKSQIGIRSNALENCMITTICIKIARSLCFKQEVYVYNGKVDINSVQLHALLDSQRLPFRPFFE